jgi:hypothetical protein
VLRKTGIDVTFVREGHAGTRTIEINNRRKTEEPGKTASAASSASAANEESSENSGTGSEDADTVQTPAAAEGVSDKPLRNNQADTAATADAVSQQSVKWRARL